MTANTPRYPLTPRLDDIAAAAEALLQAEDAVRDAINGQGHPGSEHDRALCEPREYVHDYTGHCAACGGAQYGTEDTKNTALADLRVVLGHESLPFEWPTTRLNSEVLTPLTPAVLRGRLK